MKKLKFNINGSNNKLITGDITFKTINETKPIILFIHGFKGFKDWGAHHLIAKYFAEQGYIFAKFNFSHNGVSENDLTDINNLNDFAENTITYELHDLEIVLKYLYQVYQQEIILIGHSKGGAITILKARSQPYIKKIITWNSIIDFSTLWRNYSESEWMTNGKIYIPNARTGIPMPLNKELLLDYEVNKNEFNILRVAQSISSPWLILHGSADLNISPTIAQELKDSNLNAQLKFIEQANHVFGASHPYHSEILPEHLKIACDYSIKFIED